MISKHAFSYLLSHGVPAIVSFLSIAIFSRMLAPEEYGTYAVVFAIAAIINAVVFDWLKISLLRFYPKFEQEPNFLETIKVTFVSLALLTLTGGIVVSLFYDSEELAAIYIFIAVILSWTQSWQGLNLSLVRAQLSPRKYGYLAFSRATGGLLFGSLLIYLGFGAKGLLFGIMIGFWLTLIYPTLKYWKPYLKPSAFNKKYVQTFFKYGMPLTVTLMLSIIIHNSDRLIISYLLGKDATGVYSVSYDLSEQTIFTLMMVINLAAFPIVIKTNETKGLQAAYEQVKKNTSLLLMIALPAATGFVLLSPNIVNIVLGEAYREAALILIPYIAVGAVLKGFKLYSIDIMFHLSQKTSIQMIPVAISAVVNVGLNFLLIPRMGIEGAAVSTIIAYLLAVILSWILVKLRMEVPFPLVNFLKIVVAVVVMALALWPIKDAIGIWMAIVQVLLGGLVYLLMAVVLNIEGVRDIVKKKAFKKSGAN
ncbi:lipopolysaccharide biosynthesis protein [Bacillus salacetis]|uniref:lipopolysaccharide biosynthesis protein n=1 Tax=Bacillus salacetis TaxID=2315464 RepID=UPI003B9E56AF